MFTSICLTVHASRKSFVSNVSAQSAGSLENSGHGHGRRNSTFQAVSGHGSILGEGKRGERT